MRYFVSRYRSVFRNPRRFDTIVISETRFRNIHNSKSSYCGPDRGQSNRRRYYADNICANILGWICKSIRNQHFVRLQESTSFDCGRFSSRLRCSPFCVIDCMCCTIYKWFSSRINFTPLRSRDVLNVQRRTSFVICV